MFEDLESIVSATHLTEGLRNSISIDQAEYINECVEGGNISVLIDRIDELSLYQPPKGVDSDRSVAELIEPVKEQMDSKYLEAPNDSEQISQICDFLSETPELQYENWETLTPSERLNVLQKVEYEIAEIEHREPCPIIVEVLPDNEYGFYSPENKTITVNERYLCDTGFNGYKETLDTLIHEGRHAYQDYNLTQREVHPRSGEVNNWKWNEYGVGYLSADLYGYEIYSVQVVEADAKAFAADVLKNYLNKTI